MSCDVFKQGDWVVFHDDDEDLPDLVGQIIDIDKIMVKMRFDDPDFYSSSVIVNKYNLTKITKEVADIMKGV